MASGWYMHDAGFFRLELPRGWAVEQPNTGTVLLRHDRDDVALTLVAVSRLPAGMLPRPGQNRPKPSPMEAQNELQKWLYAQRHITMRQVPRLMSGTAYPTATTEGLQQVSPPANTPLLPWYKRIFQGRSTMLWRFWAIVNPHLLVLISCNGKPAAVERQRPLVDRMIHSLHLPEQDILVGRTFTETVVSLARTWYPQTAVAIVDDGHLQFGSRSVSLVPLHRHYLASPQDLPRQVRAFFAAVQGQMAASALAGSWAHARDRILPVLMTSIALNNAQGRTLFEPWVNGLSIGYIMEEALPLAADDGPVGEPSDRSITLDDIARWNVTAEELHSQALANLVLFSHEHTMQGPRAEGITMLCLGGSAAAGAGDRHNAARLLLPELHRKLREHLGTTFYAAVPTRDWLLAFSIVDEDVLERVRQQVAADFSRAGLAGLSPKLFLVTPDGIAGDPNEQEDFG